MVNGRGPCLWWPNHLLRPQVVIFFGWFGFRVNFGWQVFRVVFFLFGSFQKEYWANFEQGKELELWNNNNKVCKTIQSLVLSISFRSVRNTDMAWFLYDIHVIVCDVSDGTGRSPLLARTVTGKDILANSGGIRAAAGDTSMKWEMVHHAKST